MTVELILWIIIGTIVVFKALVSLAIIGLFVYLFLKFFKIILYLALLGLLIVVVLPSIGIILI
jgi:hypothetical protein